MRDGGAHDVDRADDVQVEGAAPVVGRGGLEASHHRIERGDLHERVDSAEALRRGREERLAARRVGDVGRAAQHPLARRIELGRGLPELLLAACGDRDARPVAERDPRHLASEPRPDADHDHDLVLQDHGRLLQSLEGYRRI